MAETEKLIYINGYAWVQVPSNSTQPWPLYSVQQVVAAGGNPEVVRGQVIVGKI